MATLTITIPDTIYPRVEAALTQTWTAASGMTRGAYAKQQVIDMIKRKVIAYEQEIAMRSAAENTRQSVQTDIILS